MVETVSQRLEVDLIYNLADESKLKEELGLALRNASLAHIEHGGCVELAHSGTVGTFHVIGVNLQHGLGEHSGRLGGAQILVGHLRLGLLTVVANMDQSSESTNGLAIQHIFIKFV